MQNLQAEGCETWFPSLPAVAPATDFSPKDYRVASAAEFPNANRALLDQYAFAFEKVFANADAIFRGTPYRVH